MHRLIDFASEEDQEVSARALVALVILLFQYDHRIEFYPNILTQAKALEGGPEAGTEPGEDCFAADPHTRYPGDRQEAAGGLDAGDGQNQTQAGGQAENG